MVVKRFLSIALAGLLVVTSINAGNLTAYAGDPEPDSISITNLEDEAANLEETGVSDEIVVEDQLDEETEESDEIIIEDDAEDAIEEATEEDAVVITDDTIDTVIATFNANGGVFENNEETFQISVAKGGLLTETIAPVKTGYRFDGWFLDQELTKAVDFATFEFVENSVFYAKWQEKAEGEDDEEGYDSIVKLTLNANGGVFPSGKTFTTISYITGYLENDRFKPSFEGKAFTGWYSEKECKTLLSRSDNLYELMSTPDEGSVLYAGWTDAYTITFEFGTETGTDGVKNTGYYRKWDSSIDGYAHIKKFVVNIPKGVSIGNYINDIYNGNIRNADLHYEANGKWYTDVNRTSVIDDTNSFVPDKSMTIYAGYEKKNHVVTIHSKDTNSYFPYEVYQDYDEAGKFSSMKVKASISGPTYFNLSDSYVKNNDPAKIIEGLYKDEACTQKIETSSSYSWKITFDKDTDLYIKWKNAKAVVTFDLNNPTGYTVKYSETERYNVRSNDPIKIATDGEEQWYGIERIKNSNLHYTFLGWSTKKDATAPDEGYELKDDSYSGFYAKFTTDTTLYGVWKKDDSVIVATFDAKNGWMTADDARTSTHSLLVKNGIIDEYWNIPKPVAKDEKLLFEGWYDGETKVNEWYNYTITKDTTFTAKYVSTVKLTLHANGGYFTDDEKEVTEKVVQIPAGTLTYLDEPYTYENKAFGGWYYDEKLSDPVGSKGIRVTKDTHVYARWLDIYTITFDAQEGSFDDSKSKKLYYSTQGFSFDDSQYYYYNSIPESPTPNDSNKVFKGWYLDKEGKNRITTSEILAYVATADTTFYAVYSGSYNVTFDVGTNKGTFVSREGDTYVAKVAQNEELRSKVPAVKSTETKAFKGWFTKAEGGEEIKNVYSYKVTSDVKLYAQFTECYVITFHANQEGATLDGGKTDIKVLVTKGTALRYSSDEGDSKSDRISNSPTLYYEGVKTGKVPYRFIDYRDSVGWTTTADGSGDIYLLGEYSHRIYSATDGSSTNFGMYGFVPTGNMDFYAKWADPVKVTFDTNGGGTFKEGDSYDQYGVLSADKTQRVLTVAKGTIFEIISKPYSSALIPADKEKAEVSFYYSDKECKEYISGGFVINSDLMVYGRWYSSGGGEDTTKTVRLHAQEGYFDEIYETIVEYDYKLNTRYGSSRLVPSINDPNKAFLGWYTKPDGKTLYGEQFYSNGYWYVLFNKDVTDLYAIYGPAYTVKVDANGGYFDLNEDRQKDPSVQIREATSYTIKPTVSGYGFRISDYTKRIRRDGEMIFAGWYEDQALTKKATLVTNSTYDEYYVPKANVTLYAKWVNYELPSKVTASADKTEIKVDEKAKLTAAVEPAAVADTQDVHWFISNYGYEGSSNGRYPAELATDGTVTGITGGYINVYAEVNGVRSNVIKVNVAAGNVPTSIKLSTDKLTLGVDEEETVTAIVTPSGKASAVTWSSDNKSVATVTGSGATATIKGIKKGTAKITAKVDGKSASLEVTVEEKAKSITLSQTELSLTAAPGNKAEITATLGKEYEGKKVLWSSSLPEVATVLADATDSTKAVIDPADEIEETGQTTITATIEGTEETASCIVTVRPVGKALAPYADVPSGTVKKGTLVSLHTDTLGADIFYTLDGTDPGTKAEGSTKVYDDAIAITADTVIKALAYQEGVKTSAIAVYTYTVDINWGDISDEIAKDIFGNDITKVSDGIWYLIGNKEYKEAGKTTFMWNYTGEKETFNDDIAVYDNTSKLVENRDYTITYTNNLNAAKVTDAKAPKFTIKGKGVYNASADFLYTINPADINNAVLTSEDDVAVVEGKTKLSSVKVTLDYAGKILKAGKDYQLTYKADGKEVLATTVLDTAGKTYTVEISGIGNFANNYASAITVEVIKKDKSVVPASALKAVDAKGKALSTPYDGKAVDIISKFDNSKAENKPEWFVVYGKEKLTYGTDYTIQPAAKDDNTSAGAHDFVIKGIRKTAEGQISYIGSKNCSYNIVGTDIKKAKFTSFSTTVPYTGEVITMDDLGTIKLTGPDGKTLERGKDFEAVLCSLVASGKFKVMFTGLGGYYGTVYKTVTIKARKLTDKDVTITVNNGQDVAYAKGAVKPEVTVTLKNGNELLQGVDYKLSYKNNSKVGDKGAGKKAPAAVISGIGNYAGTKLSMAFTITKANVSQISVVAKDVVYNEKGKAGYFLVTPKLTDNGKSITAGKGKDVEKIAKQDYLYTYLAQTKLVDGKIKAAGDTVDKNDKVPANTTIVVTVPVKCSDKSSYKADVPEIVGYYRVVAKDLSKAKITVKAASKSKLVVNKGEAVKLLKSDLEVKIGKTTTLTSGDYEIVSITNNKLMGTATLTIRGKGNYGGTKSVKLKITAKSIKK